MVRCLEQKDRIILSSSGNQTEFIIDEIVGVGGRCIAYKVSYKENGEILHRGILKEFFPAFLISEGATMRSGTSVVVPDAFAMQFSVELENFKKTYRVINEYLSNNLSAANYHTVQMGLYVGNNTAYTLTSCDYGKSYDKLKDTNLHTMFKLMYSVTKAVELYHNAGFLHLDIKPKNILVLDEVTDVVKLFDFDSLIPLQSFVDRTVESVPVPGEYYVPELSNCEVRNIGIHTDVFEIGAMVFNRLFGRYPEPADMRYDAVYPFEHSPLFVGVSPQAKHEIELLLRKTIQISKRNRYQNTTDLKKQLKRIVSLIGSDAPYLVDLPKWQPTRDFIGRSQDIKELEQRLCEYGYVFVKGIGGLGKSELVKYYVKKFASKYHTVQFCKYDDSLKSVVATLSINGVDDGSFNSFEELVRHKNKILHTCDEHTLIIVDNFNVTHDKFLREFLPSDNNSFKVIFTTRCNLAADYYADKIMNLSKLSMEECKKLYCTHSGYDADDDCVDSIIEMVDYNTLVLVLLAETMRKAGKSPEEILSILEKQELDQEQALVFHEYDYSAEEIDEYNKINSHLNVIFDISSMSPVEKQLLKAMSLVSQRGIKVEDFLNYCNNEAFSSDMISVMSDLGWLEFRNELLVMHPIVSDLLFMNNDIISDESYYNLADNLEDLCNPDYISHISVVMDRVACALHLDRRYKNEDEERRIVIKSKLGRLYANIYRPKQAREALLDAINLANETGRTEFLPYIYSFAGEVEKDFGTISSAIEFYEKAIAEGRKPENDYCEIVLESMMNVAACLVDNGDLISANISYDEALYFAQLNSLDSYVSEIAKELVTICTELELPGDVEKYTLIMQEYARYAEECDYVPQKIKEMEQLTNTGDYVASMLKYESFLEEKREELGEDSPIYQDVARNRWVFYAISNDCEQAKRLVAQNLSFVEEKFGSDSMEMAEQLVTISQIFPKLQEFDYAIESAKRAIEICNALNQNRTKVALEARLALANCYLILGNPDKAKSTYSDVDFTSFSGTEMLAEIVTSAGQVLCELSEYEIVEQMCVDLLKRGAVDRFSRAQTYIIYAMCREQKGLLDEAEDLCEQAKPLIEAIVDETIRREWLIQYYRTSARLEYRRGNYKNAIAKINEFLSQFPDEQKDSFILFQVISERGLYYASNKDVQLAIRDYELAERILLANNMPGESFVLLYNNISVHFCNLENYEKAKEYLDKIVAIKPSVLNPTSYSEALICSNIGWIALNEDDVMQAGRMFNRAAKAFISIGATKSADYLTTLHNLSLAYEKRKMYEKCQKIYQIIFNLYDEKCMDADGKFRKLFTTCYVRTLLEDEKYSEATDFVTVEDQCNVNRFGESSVQRIDFLLQVGSYLKAYGIEFCMSLYKSASDAVKIGGHQDTIYNARLLNYIGVCYTDFYEDYGFAIRLFNDAKGLFEKIGATEDEMYPVVISNIKYAEDKQMDQLIKDLADSIMNDESNDDDE